MPKVIVGPAQRSFHRQLLASKAFEALPPSEQAAIAALDPKVRTALFDVWEPAGVEFGTELDALQGCFVFELERRIRAALPHVPMENVLGDDWSEFTVFANAHLSVTFKGLDRHGDPIAAAGTVTAHRRNGNKRTTKTISSADAACELVTAHFGGKR